MKEDGGPSQIEAKLELSGLEPPPTPSRRALMSRVRTRNTGPEMTVRRLLHTNGYRYRLHVKDLPGRPDLVFRSRRKVIFVHGCFWHRHPGCRRATLPKTRTRFWENKLESNRRRDVEVMTELRRMGWCPFVVWECETKMGGAHLLRRLTRFLEEDAERCDY